MDRKEERNGPSVMVFLSSGTREWAVRRRQAARSLAPALRLTAGAGTRCMSLLSSSPSLQTVRSVLGDEVFLMFPVKSQAHESSLFYPLLMIHRLGFVGGPEVASWWQNRYSVRFLPPGSWTWDPGSIRLFTFGVDSRSREIDTKSERVKDQAVEHNLHLFLSCSTAWDSLES